MNEFIIENADHIPFRGMSEEDQHAIVDAKLRRPDIVEMYCSNYWGLSGGSSLVFEYIYRVRAIATPIVIPWEIISPKWDWVAMDADKRVHFFTREPRAAKLEWVCSVGGDYIGVQNILTIDTTSIDWRMSKTRRPV